MPNQAALITGGSSGIGLALAKMFARNKYTLVITARKQEELDKAAADIRSEFAVTVKTIANDLSKPEASQQIFDWCKQQHITVEVLINNAGFGTYGKFAETDLAKQLNLIDLNIRGLTNLTGLFLPQMLERKSGKILNVSSTAAFQPGPLMACYYASKAYVLSFSEALHNELAGSGVSVTALCPGATTTNFQKINQEFGQTRLIKSGRLMTADKVAHIGFDALMKNKSFVIPGLTNKLMAFSTRFGPRNLVTAISRWVLER